MGAASKAGAAGMVGAAVAGVGGAATMVGTAVAERVGQEVDAVRERFERGGQISAVRSDVRKRKALEWLLERAEVLDPEGATIDRSELELPSDEDDDTATTEVADGTEGDE